MNKGKQHTEDNKENKKEVNHDSVDSYNSSANNSKTEDENKPNDEAEFENPDDDPA